MTRPQRYRKRPVEIEAMRWSGESAEEGFAILAWAKNHGCFPTLTEAGIEIPTLEGTMLAVPGDWIIRGVQGEFYPCKPAIFDATYDRVHDDGVVASTAGPRVI